MNNEQMEKREEEAEPLNQMFQTENSESKIHFSWHVSQYRGDLTPFEYDRITRNSYE